MGDHFGYRPTMPGDHECLTLLNPVKQLIRLVLRLLQINFNLHANLLIRDGSGLG